jgi:PleD family two-component response regulator
VRSKVSVFSELYRRAEEAKRRAALEAADRQLEQDLAELRRAQLELERMAHYDGLTGLANRTLLLDRLEQELASSERHGEQLAVLFIDLDRFAATASWLAPMSSSRSRRRRA